MQVWDYCEDGAIVISISQGYERDGNIIYTSDFEEKLIPFPIALARATLKGLGYAEPVIKPCPWFEDKPVEETGWYCFMAQKPGHSLP